MPDSSQQAQHLAQVKRSGGTSQQAQHLAQIKKKKLSRDGRVIFADLAVYARDDRRQVDLWLTDQPPSISGGYGGFQPQQRPRKPSLTPWAGREPFQITVPGLLYAAGDSVTDALHTLDVLASGTSKGPPPIVRVAGAIQLPRHASRDYVIQDLAWGDQVRRHDHTITWQQVTLTLLEYVDDQALAASTLTDRRGRKTVVRHYHVKKGDTLRSIAARELGDAKRWVDIAGINGLRSSGTLTTGQTLRLP